MTPEQLAWVRLKVEKRIAEIDVFLAEDDPESKPVAPDVAIGRLSRLESMQSQQMSLAQQRRQREEKERLENALDRIKKGPTETVLIAYHPYPTNGLKPCPMLWSA